MRAAVIIPAGYDQQSSRKYPVVYSVPGFGGRHFGAWDFLAPPGRVEEWSAWPYKGLMVVLDPAVPLGHSVFANSENNGPVGDALIHELIPEIERRFHAVGRPEGRFVTGHSSGGWSSLWLQVTYPDFFGGCWSTSPDPVDFTRFQTVDIYHDENAHWTPEGYPRGIARGRHKLWLTFSELDLWEYVTGPGFQLESFNAVFSPRGQDGRPVALVNKLTGEIDPAVAEAWKKYDIRLILENNWRTLGPKLKGKIHVLCGGWDTFYLNPAVVRLRSFLHTTDFGGYVEIVPGDHGLSEGVPKRIANEMADKFRASGFQ